MTQPHEKIFLPLRSSFKISTLKTKDNDRHGNNEEMEGVLLNEV